MAQPTRAEIHIDGPLTNISIAHLQSEANFAAGRVFPMLPVQKQSDKYFTYPKDWFRRTDAQKRAPATESAGSGYVQSSDSYFADVWALHHDVPWQDEPNTDSPLNLRQDAAVFLMQQMLIRREVQFMADAFTTGVWTGGTTGTDIVPGTLWDVDSSDVIDQIDEQKESFAQNSGADYEPNTLVVGRKVHRALKGHPDLIDRIKHTQRGVLTEDLIASLLGVDRYIVCNASRNTAGEDLTATNAFIGASDDALLCYVNPTPGLRQPSAGYIFTWSGYLAGAAFGIATGQFDMDEIKATRIETEMAFDNKIVSPTLGVYFNGAVS